jgi:hypothetical protein
MIQLKSHKVLRVRSSAREEAYMYVLISVICIQMARETIGTYGAGCPRKHSPATRLRWSGRFRSMKSGARVRGAVAFAITVPILLTYLQAKINTLERFAISKESGAEGVGCQ